MGKGVADLIEVVLFTYSTKHLNKSDKVRFYYALKGRNNNPGVLKKYVYDHLAKTVLLVLKKNELPIEEFLNVWKCKYKKKRLYIEKV